MDETIPVTCKRCKVKVPIKLMKYDIDGSDLICFDCYERQIKGVKETAVGYMGGGMENPSYEDVCTDKTGHAEVIQISFESKETAYEKLLNVFWMAHNPVQANGQGHDIGTQYRSVIFYHTPEQKVIAEKSTNVLQMHLDVL